eukprot:m.288258 g.288258  ORF g.288258 m.288258 type:complete len:379 (+) comp19959_c0_seq2:107-1243(+)
MAGIKNGIAAVMRSAWFHRITTSNRAARIGARFSSNFSGSLKVPTVTSQGQSRTRLRVLGALGAGVATGMAYLQYDRHVSVQCQSKETETKIARPPKRGSTSASHIPAVYDTYGGVILARDATGQYSSVDEFSQGLKSSLAVWQDEGCRGIWLELPASRLDYAAAAVQQEGFVIHHAEHDHIMLTKWLPGGKNPLPGYTSHSLGVGAVVINDRNEVLVVQEKTGPASGINFWKYPTGMVDAGEDAAIAAVREVREETGIDAEVVELVAFREFHAGKQSGWMSGKTNVFLVFLLRAKSTDICIQEAEIADCKWIPRDEYIANMELRMQPGTIHHTINMIAFDMWDKKTRGFECKEYPQGFRPGSAMLYRPPEQPLPSSL